MMYIKEELTMSVTETNMANLRSHLADALEQVADGNIVLVKRRGKRYAALIDGELLEDFLAATNPRVVKKVAQARKEIATGKIVTFDDVLQDILD